MGMIDQIFWTGLFSYGAFNLGNRILLRTFFAQSQNSSKHLSSVVAKSSSTTIYLRLLMDPSTGSFYAPILTARLCSPSPKFSFHLTSHVYSRSHINHLMPLQTLAYNLKDKLGPKIETEKIIDFYDKFLIESGTNGRVVSEWIVMRD